jgi:hypothetical protein
MSPQVPVALGLSFECVELYIPRQYTVIEVMIVLVGISLYDCKLLNWLIKFVCPKTSQRVTHRS